MELDRIGKIFDPPMFIPDLAVIPPVKKSPPEPYVAHAFGSIPKVHEAHVLPNLLGYVYVSCKG